MVRDMELIIKEIAFIAVENTYHYKNMEEYDSPTEFFLAYVNEDDFEADIRAYMTSEEVEEYSVIEVWNQVKEYIVDVAMNEF
jgi:hypothetical protein